MLCGLSAREIVKPSCSLWQLCGEHFFVFLIGDNLYGKHHDRVLGAAGRKLWTKCGSFGEDNG